MAFTCKLFIVQMWEKICVLSVKMPMEGSALDHSEVYNWLKSLSPGLKLERLSAQFESRGFRSRRSLSYVKSEDLDSFFPSPDKLLLAERRVLEAELEKIRTDTVRRSLGLEPR